MLIRKMPNDREQRQIHFVPYSDRIKLFSVPWSLLIFTILLSVPAAQANVLEDCVALARIASWEGAFGVTKSIDYNNPQEGTYGTGQENFASHVVFPNLLNVNTCLSSPDTSNTPSAVTGVISNVTGAVNITEGDHVCEGNDPSLGSWTTIKTDSTSPVISNSSGPRLQLDSLNGLYKLGGGSITFQTTGTSYTNCNFNGSTQILDTSPGSRLIAGLTPDWLTASLNSFPPILEGTFKQGSSTQTWYLEGKGQKPLPAPQKPEFVRDACNIPNASTISCENQGLGEKVEVAGTPFALHYQSDRVKGRVTQNTPIYAHDWQLSGWTLTPHHHYDSQNNILYLGDGSRREPTELLAVKHNLSGDYLIASEDGSEVYQFAGNSGRHLKTLSGLTGETLYTFEYDTNNQYLIRITDAFDNNTEIQRNNIGRATSIVGPYGQITKLTINSGNYVTEIQDPMGGIDKFTIQSKAKKVTVHGRTFTFQEYKGLLSKHTNPRGKISKFNFDATGKLIKDIDAAGGFQSLTRIESGNNFTVLRRTAEGRKTRYDYKAGSLLGEDRKTTNPAGLDSTLSRTPTGDETQTAPDGMTSTATLAPDPRFGYSASFAEKSSVKSPSGKELQVQRSITPSLNDATDPFSLTALTETVSINGQQYNSAFDAPSLTYTLTTPAGRKSTVTIDKFGRPVKREQTGLLALTYSYDSHGRLSDVSQGNALDARTVQFSYDDQGYVAGVTDSLNRQVTLKNDALGRVTQQTLPGNRTIAYTYDTNGNITGLTPPGRPEHRFAYTNVDTVASYTAPVLDKGTSATKYSYNRDRQPVQIVQPGGRKISQGYDSAGRLTSVKTKDGMIRVSYDSATGHLNTLSTRDGSLLSYTYDGSLVTKVALTGSVSGSVQFSYDNNFRLDSVSAQGANPVAYGYDPDGLLTTAGTLTLNYDPANGLLTGTRLGDLSDVFGYDGFGEVRSYEANYQNGSLLRFEYTYDELSRMILKKEIKGNVTDIFDYGYDEAGRLFEVKHNGTVTATYGYDANGNRTQLNGATIAHYDAQDRLLDYQNNTYQYTANGELQQKTANGGTTRYDYDELGNLRHVTLPDGHVIEYLIDGRNRRIGKKVDGSLKQGWLWQDQLKPIAELDGNGNIVSRFVYATGINVPDYIIKANSSYRIIKDHLGSPCLVINTDNGSIVQQLDYDEFGNVLVDTNPGFQPFGFAGGLYDRDTKLIRFGRRDYDPLVGRWTMKDPILHQSRTANLYEYASSTPINLIDPNGQTWKSWKRRAAAVVAAIELALTKGKTSKIGSRLVEAEKTEEKVRQMTKNNRKIKRTPGAGPDPDEGLSCGEDETVESIILDVININPALDFIIDPRIYEKETGAYRFFHSEEFSREVI